MTHATSRMISEPRYSIERRICTLRIRQRLWARGDSRRGERTSVVMTRQLAVGLIVTSPVMRPTSPNSASISRYFWFDSACEKEHETGRLSDVQESASESETAQAERTLIGLV